MIIIDPVLVPWQWSSFKGVAQFLIEVNENAFWFEIDWF